jgi:hypothetical protein
MSRESIRKREAAATKGPWGWTGNLKTRWVELSTLHSGRLGVMRFERWGMTGAQPVFLDPDTVFPGTMLGSTRIKASDVPIFEVAPHATSADDIRVYRSDILGLRHPDATFMAAARTDVPLLLAVADAAAGLVEHDLQYGDVYEVPVEALERLRAALAALDGAA